MTLSSEIARDLLAIKAVQIRPDDYFTWTSGIKSPIYCDNRLTMSYPAVRRKIVQAFVAEIKAMDEQPDIIAGCATAGIPHAAWLAEALDLPMIYVRSSAKAHGKGNQIEGKLEAGQKVIVVEDLISTGGSALQAAEAIIAAGAEVISTCAIFTYGLSKSIQHFHERNIPLFTITSYDDLVVALVEDNVISQAEQAELLAWRKQLSS